LNLFNFFPEWELNQPGGDPMYKKGQKAPKTSGKGTKANKNAAMVGGITVSGSKPGYPPK